MKSLKYLVLCMALFMASTSFGQKFTTDGFWAGVIPVKDDIEDEGFPLLLYIENGQAREIEWSNEQNEFYFVTHEKEIHTNLRNNISFTWMNQGGVWSETQSFTLTSINEEMMSVVWVRHVNNEEDATYNTDWNTVREGHLIKYEYDELASLLRQSTAE